MSVGPVNSIGTSLITASNKLASGSSQANASSALAEAKESEATTAKEARNGDRVAQRKLQAIEARKQGATDEAKTSEPSKGNQVDHVA